MRRLQVLTTALLLAACSENPIEPTFRNPVEAGSPHRFISGVTWTMSSTNVEMIDMGRFDGRSTFPIDINDAGQVVGYYYMPTGNARAFIWENGVYEDLGTLGGDIAVAHQISNSGVIIGYSYNADGKRRPAVWRNKVISQLPATPGNATNTSMEGKARAINANGDIVGYYGNDAVKWTPNAQSYDVQIIGVFDGEERSEAYGINASGLVIGTTWTSGSFVHKNWRWSGGSMTAMPFSDSHELAALSAESGRIFNDAGHVVGSMTDENWNTRAWVYRDGQVQLLPHASSDMQDGFAAALGVNEAGDVAGVDIANNWTWRAVVWPRNGAAVDLGLAPGGFMSRASGVNNGSYAVGQSLDASDNSSGVIWRWLGDRTTPMITGSVQGTLGLNDWYVSDVNVSWTLNDAESGIKSSSNCQAAVYSLDSQSQTVTCSATNGADLTTSATVTFKRDATPPSVVYNNTGSYTVDQVIAISCDATDATSGIASHTCQPINGEAMSFGLGSHTFTAEATDNAGHRSTGSATFTISVTLPSLAALTRRYSSNAQFGEMLARLLMVAEQLRNHQNTLIADLALRGYVKLVQDQSGKAFTAEQAAVLLELSKNFTETRASRKKPKKKKNYRRGDDDSDG